MNPHPDGATATPHAADGGRGETSAPEVAGYHAHIYFDPANAEQLAAALALRDEIAARFPRAALGRVHHKNIAFHPKPMYQVAIDRDDFADLIPHLMLHHRDLSVLVHPLLGDTWLEHTAHALWIGPALPLDLERLGKLRP